MFSSLCKTNSVKMISIVWQTKYEIFAQNDVHSLMFDDDVMLVYKDQNWTQFTMAAYGNF